MATATLGKWGNATGVRIPQPYCQQLGISAGSTVNITIEDKRIVIEPEPERYTLQARMKNWDGERYQSDECDWGAPQGEELW